MTILELLEEQQAFVPNPVPASYPYNVPARNDALAVLLAFVNAYDGGEESEIEEARAALDESAD
jgi:hypothetical protein